MQYGSTESRLQVMLSSGFDCSARYYCSEKMRQLGDALASCK